MGEGQEICECIRCGRKLTRQEYETYSNLCEECHEIEINELDYEDEHGLCLRNYRALNLDFEFATVKLLFQ